MNKILKKEHYFEFDDFFGKHEFLEISEQISEKKNNMKKIETETEK